MFQNKIERKDSCVHIITIIKVIKISEQNFAKPLLRLFYNREILCKSFAGRNFRDFTNL